MHFKGEISSPVYDHIGWTGNGSQTAGVSQN